MTEEQVLEALAKALYAQVAGVDAKSHKAVIRLWHRQSDSGRRDWIKRARHALTIMEAEGVTIAEDAQ